MQVHQTPTLLLTRPRAASERFAKGMTGAQIVIAPLMEIVGTGAQIDLNGVDALILTSEAAVAFLPKSTLPAYCVGPRTTGAARVHGLVAEAAGSDAEGLVQTLTDRRPKGRLLHLHGTHTRGDIAQRLTAIGLNASSHVIYDQLEMTPYADFYAALRQPRLIVPLFSPRSAKLFARAAKTLRADTQLIALSPAVADALPPAMRPQTSVAQSPTGEDLRKVLEPFGVNRNSPLEDSAAS